MADPTGPPRGPRIAAALVSVGDELLLGETVDTNAAWLGRELAAMGIPVVAGFTVPDDGEGIRKALTEAISLASLVVVTGGLGPTRDDLTLASVAEHLGRALSEDPGLLAALEERFRARGLSPLPPSNRSQALVPEGAEAMPNPLGTAPGILFDLAEAGLVVLLPGVPSEMKAIFAASVAPAVRSRFAGRLAPVAHRMIRTTGIAESVLADRLDPLLDDLPEGVSVAFLPDVVGVDLRLTARGFEDPAEAEEALSDLAHRLGDVVGPFRFESVTGDLAQALGDRLVDLGLTVAVAESCTGGLIAKRLTDVPGASRYFLGGVAAYSNGAKGILAGVDPALTEEIGAVSSEVAVALADGVRARLSADAGIGVTGIAGPGGGTEDKPVGTVWFAASLGARTEVRREVFSGDRDMVRHRAAQAAMALLLRLLGEDGEGRALGGRPDGVGQTGETE